MKSVAVLLLIALVTFGLVGGAIAQTSSSPIGDAMLRMRSRPRSDTKRCWRGGAVTVVSTVIS